MINNYTATVIGFIFSVSSWLATWTFIIPFLTVLPLSLILENGFSNTHYGNDYNIIGPLILKTIWILFLFIVIISYALWVIRIIRGKPVSKLSFSLFLTLQLFIVHPLFFYIDTSQNWNRASDGQFILGVTETFPKSSLVFIFFGILLDLLRLLKTPNQGDHPSSQMPQ